ncbi:MAG: hypothetical protein HS115_06850 [Spirochaetales bacterium]|nr:hypothetical protein [Spirochaetales bacterium]
MSYGQKEKVGVGLQIMNLGAVRMPVSRKMFAATAAQCLAAVLVFGCFSIEKTIDVKSTKPIRETIDEAVGQPTCALDQALDADKLALAVQCSVQVARTKNMETEEHQVEVRSLGALHDVWRNPVTGIIGLILSPILFPIDLLRSIDIDRGIVRQKRSVALLSETRSVPAAGKIRVEPGNGASVNLDLIEGKVFVPMATVSDWSKWGNPEVYYDGKIIGRVEASAMASKFADRRKDAQEAVWKSDSNTILSLIKDARAQRILHSHTTIQAEEQKKKLVTENLTLNKRHTGTLLSLSAVRIEDVTEDKELTPAGKKKILEQLAGLKRKEPDSPVFLLGDDPRSNFLLALYLGVSLAKCDECFASTGRYIVEYSVPVPSDYAPDGYSGSGIFLGKRKYGGNDTMSTEIRQIVPQFPTALAQDKGKIRPVTGRIRQIVYKGEYSESVRIELD